MITVYPKSIAKKAARFIIGTKTSGWTEKDCDFLCDGVNDQIEINMAISLAGYGCEIIILDGTYNITAPIDINKDNVSIRGNGNATILKRMWDSSSFEGVIMVTSVEGCKVENLQIDGNKATYNAAYNYGIYLDTSSNNNNITGNTCNANNNGIYLDTSSNNNNITGNTCNDNTSGIYLDTSSNNNITGNSCNNNYYGIYLDTSNNNNNITGNTCNANGSGIYLDTSSNNNNITDNTCNDNGSGIYLDTSSNNTVTGNTCNNNNNGIYLSSSSNNSITGNTCNDNDNGITFSSSSNNTGTGNTCNYNNNGIYLRSSSNNSITGNTCNNNDNGIFLYLSSNNNNITGNTCIRGTGQTTDYGTLQYPIQLAGDYNLITNNNCMGKAVLIGGGSNGNSVWGNKWDAGNDLPV